MAIFDIEHILWNWSAKNLSSAIYHIIKLPFDAKVTEKFLNGIYQVTSVIERELDWFINNEKAVGKEPTSNYRRFGEDNWGRNFIGIEVICDGYHLDFFEGLSDFRLKQIILRSKVLRHHFYLPKVIIQVQTGLEYSAD